MNVESSFAAACSWTLQPQEVASNGWTRLILLFSTFF